MWTFAVERPALVLGSTQTVSVVDGERAAAAGVEVVWRRSGGGAVLLEPGGALWVDVVVPRGDPLWDDDVSRSGLWLGDVWAAALARFGVTAAVHRGPIVRTRWSPLVCFAGLAPGEATAGGAKVLGVSQRRTRAAARFQCAVPVRWDPVPLLDLLVLPEAEREAGADELAGAAAGVGVAVEDLEEALLTLLS